MINDLVSIVMPVFHAEAFLEKTVETVQEQTYKNWELIAVDDCSGDGSFELLCRLAEADGRIRPVRQEHNQGAAASRNKGVELAQGRYLAYLDADDLWTKTKLEKELARVNGMLNNERFISKAPESKVQEEREKLERYTNMMEQVKERLAQLQ